jgi:hypothetical protein
MFNVSIEIVEHSRYLLPGKEKEKAMMFVLLTKRIFGIFFVAMFLLLTSVASAFAVSTVHAASQTISPTNPNIKYVGRWDTRSSTVYTSYWPGAYFVTQFTGTTVAIQLASSVNIYVTIDNGADTLYSRANGTVNLTPKPLAAGTHLLRVVARYDTDFIALQGLVLDAGATTVAPTLSSKLVEFVGDSITTGYSNSKYALSDYAWLTGEQLGVQHTQIAQDGICLVDNIQCYSPNAIGMSRQFFKLQTASFPNSPNWDFSRYQASAVVINLGGCDDNFTSNATFQSSYETFLRNVRQVYPAARIFALRGFTGRKAAPTLAAVQAVGDKNVQYVDTTGWLNSSDFNDVVHPSDAGHAKIAGLLAPIIKAYLGGDSMVPLASYLNNKGIGSAARQANFDGSGYAYPASQLPSGTVTLNNIPYQLPTSSSGNDNVVAVGQTISLPQGKFLQASLLTASSWGPVRGSTTVHYTDGSTRSVLLNVPDWYTGSSGVVTSTYRYSPNGTDRHSVSIFAIQLPLDPTKTVTSLTLPTTAQPAGFRGSIHIFALTLVSGPVTYSTLNAGGSGAGSFVTDAYYSGGRTYTTRASIDTSAVSNPAPQAVYQSERYGNFTHSVPGLIAGGTYTVRLHFAEIYWTSRGQRLFNVAINGQQVLTNFDIYATAGAANKAIVRQYTATADANGQITIWFTTVKDNAKVSGIEMLRS